MTRITVSVLVARRCCSKSRHLGFATQVESLPPCSPGGHTNRLRWKRRRTARRSASKVRRERLSTSSCERHDYAPDSTTGWHTHPGPVFITVTKGTLAFYEYDDPTCTPTFVSEGQGYVDTRRGHVGRNLTSETAQDVTVIIAPVGLPFAESCRPQSELRLLADHGFRPSPHTLPMMRLGVHICPGSPLTGRATIPDS